MSILSELEGLSGENLTTAVLRLLFLRSQDIRSQFVQLLSRESRTGPIRLNSHFSCVLEHPTEDSSRWGRLDLLLESDDAIVGLENKLHAGFQEGQPHKYFATVEQNAVTLSKLRGNDFRPLVAVLAPKSRTSEIGEVIGDDQRFLMLSWEEILDRFSLVRTSLDAVTVVLLDELKTYMDQHLALFPDFSTWVPHLRRRFDSGGTPLQREVVAKIWEFFPEGRGRLSCGHTWVGYYFTDYSIGTKAWYGFVPRDEISRGAHNPVELIVTTSFPVSLSNPPCRAIELVAGPKFLGSNQINAWALEFDESWKTPDIWRDSLKPLSDTYEILRRRKKEQEAR